MTDKQEGRQLRISVTEEVNNVEVYSLIVVLLACFLSVFLFLVCVACSKHFGMSSTLQIRIVNINSTILELVIT